MQLCLLPGRAGALDSVLGALLPPSPPRGKEKGAGNETVVSTRHLTSMKFLEAKGILTPTDLQ